MLRSIPFALCVACALPAVAATLRVGPGETYARVADAARAARDGDTVEIAAGEYRRDVAVWTQKRLTIRGLGSGAVLIADGADAEGKAIWVIRNGDFAVENVEFRGARVPDLNGAGIRFEGGRLRVRNSRFFDNEMGILTGNDETSQIVVEGSEFAAPARQRCGGDSIPHLLYVGRIARAEIVGSHFHDGWCGHLLKSRAAETVVRDNRLDDGDKGEASYELEFPNGGVARVVGNTIAQSPLTQNPILIRYGAEGAHWRRNSLLLERNTLIDRRPRGGVFLALSILAPKDVVARDNKLVGNGSFDPAYRLESRLHQP